MDSIVEIGNFRVIREIGSGATSNVFQVDRKGRTFALKLMINEENAGSADLSLRFRKEASILARLAHPSLVKVHETGDYEGRPYVAMELAKGSNLGEIILRHPMSEASTLFVAKSVLGALSHIHRSGLVHRDIKPDNILYDESDSVKLIDFGFAEEAAQISDETELVVGTVNYCSPEQSGMLSRQVDSRSDLYSLGAVIFECLAGSPVYNGTSTIEIMQQHASAPVPDIRETRPEVRPVLSAILKKALAKDPDDRYQTAEGLLRDLNNLEDLALQPDGSYLLDQESRRLQMHHEAPLVGREADFSILKQSWKSATSGRGCTIQLEGEGGSGKTRLSQELIGIAGADDFILMKGKCQESGAMPFGVVRESIDGYLVRILRLPEIERTRAIEQIRKCAGELTPIIRRLSIGLERVLSHETEAATIETVNEQGRFYGATADFILRLSKDESPVLMLIDDIQWIDQSSLEVLKRVADGGSSHRVMLVTTARNDPASSKASEHFVSELGSQTVQRIVLKPLSVDSIDRYARSFLGEKPLQAEVVERLTTATNGNAFAVGEYLRSLLASSSLSLIDGEWHVDKKRFAQLELSTNVLDLVLRRIEQLSPATMNVLKNAAIYGLNFDIVFLRGFSVGIPKSDIDRAIKEALLAKLIETDGQQGFSFVHDRVREALIADIPGQEFRNRNQFIADFLSQLEVVSDQSIFALAKHSVNGHIESHWSEIYRYCLRAGQISLDAHENTQAYELFTHAINAKKEVLLRDSKFSDTIEVELGLGTASARLGKNKEAHEQFSKCLRNARTNGDLLKSHFLNCISYLSEGNPPEAWVSLEKVLQLFGRREPKNRWLRRIGFIWFWLWAIFFEKTGIVQNTSKGRDRDIREAYSKVMPIVSKSAVFMGNLETMSFFVVREFANAQFLGVGKELASATLYYANFLAYFHTHVYRSKGLFRLFSHKRKSRMVRHFGQRAITIAEQSGDPGLIGNCTYLYGQMVGMIGASTEAVEILRKALPMQKKYNSYSEQATTIMVLSLLYQWKGLSHEVISLSERESDTMFKSDNFWLMQMIEGGAYTNLCLQGRVSEALKVKSRWQELCKKSGNFHWARSEALYEDILVLWDQREFGEELEALISQFTAMKFESYYISHVYATICYLRAEQYRRSKHATSVDEAARRLNFKKLQSAVVDFSSRSAQPIFRCHRFVSEAIICLELGNASQAQKCLDKAEKLAHESDSQWGLYETLLERARVQKAIGDIRGSKLSAEACEEIAKNQAWKNRLRYLRDEFELEKRADSPAAQFGKNSNATVSISKRSIQSESYGDAILRVGLAFASSSDPISQARSALDELVKALNAERAFLFELTPNGQFHLRAGRDSAGHDLKELKGHSSTVINKVRESLKPIVLSGTDEGEVLGSKSAVIHNLRSIMAAPLSVRDKFLGVVYLDSRLAKGLFGETELNLLSIIASHMAVSLEVANMANVELQKREMEKDLALTAAVQSFFLPTKNSLKSGNLVLSGFYQAAGQASGDWWWYREDADMVSVLVGDVTGHGAASAMLTASTSAYLLCLAKYSNMSDLADVLINLNDGFCEISQGKYSMTMSAVTISHVNNKLTWWSAGAPPIFHIDDQKKVTSLIAQGSPLGSSEFILGQRELLLKKGDRVFIFTDGLSELELPDGSELRTKGLRQILIDTRSLEQTEAMAAIKMQLERARGSTPLRDDLTFVLIDMI